MTSLAPPKPRHDCVPHMVYAHDEHWGAVCWCEICNRTWAAGQYSYEPILNRSVARSVRQRATKESSR